VNLTTPNAAIKWDEYRLHAPTEVMPLLKRNDRAIVAMTSSGIGGANGSCIVEGPPTPPTRSPGVEFWASNASSRPHLFVSGGLSPRTAVAVAEALQQQRDAGVDETALTLTYGRRVRSMPWINYSVMSSGEPASFSEPALVPKSPGSLVFVFSGQGPQHIASTSRP
jgi:acyl transferase domain-containing protein